MGLQRFVRLEKLAPLPSLDPEYVQVASAVHGRDREQMRVAQFERAGMGPGALQQRKEKLAVHEKTLATAARAKDNLGQKGVKDLMETHATSSKESPFLSITQGFTTGENSQAYYFDRGDGKGQHAAVSIFNTGRSFVNPINTREQEHLLPLGIQRRELAGTFTRSHEGYTYTDLSGGAPRSITGPEALQRFNLEAGSNYAPPGPARKKK